MARKARSAGVVLESCVTAATTEVPENEGACTQAHDERPLVLECSSAIKEDSYAEQMQVALIEDDIYQVIIWRSHLLLTL